MSDGTAAALQLAALSAIYLGFALVAGTLATEAWLRGAVSGWRRRFGLRAAPLRQAGLIGTAAAMLLAVWVQAAVMGEVPLSEAGASAMTLLGQTHAGHVALVGLAAWLAAAIAGWGGWPQGTARTALFLAAGLIALGSRSLASHAADQGDWSWAVALDAAHLLAGCIWVGIVLVAAAVRLPSPALEGERADALRWVRSLSTTATIALAAVLTTGACKVWLAVPDWSALLRSGYGATLAVKLALVATAAALGGFNRFRVVPGLLQALALQGADAGALWRLRLRRVLQIEAVVLVLVLVAAALLASSEPPGS